MKPQPQESGGCPFTSLGIEDIILLTPHLHNSPHIQQAIAKEISSGRPSTACKMLLAHAKLMYSVTGGGHKQDPSKCCNGSGKQRQNSDCKSMYSSVPINQPKEIDMGCMSCSKCPQGENKTANFNPSGSIDHVFASSASNENINKTGMKYSCVDASVVQKNISQIRGELSDALTLERQDKEEDCTIPMRKNIVTASSKSIEMKVSSCAGCGKINMRSDQNSNNLSVENDRKICDIEDIRSMLPYCQFSRPSHYYFKVCE